MFNLKMNNDEYKFVKYIINIDEHLNRIMDHVYQEYGVITEYDEENGILNLSSENVNESQQLIIANEYIKNNLNIDFITTNIK